MYFGRGPNKIKNPYRTKDMYLFYLEEIDNNELFFVEYEEYKNIVDDFYKLMMEGVLKKAKTFKFPYRLGSFRVAKKKMSLNHLNYLAIDWKKTIEYGQKVYHLNEHSRGYKYFFLWSKKRHAVQNMFLYRLVVTRTNRRLLAKLIKSNTYDYFEV